jgi:hypothetical protein
MPQAEIHVKESDFSIKVPGSLRNDPHKEFEHRLKTGAHLKYLGDRKLFNVADKEWAQKTINGEVFYAHEYEGSILIIQLKTADNKFSLKHNVDGTFDRHLMDHPGENTVYSITSSNNGLESTHTFNLMTAGVSAVSIIIASLVLTVNLANAMVAAEAAIAAEEAVATFAGVEASVFPGVGLAIAVLAFIGIWLAYFLGKEIVLNLIYENRSKKTLTLVDHYAYNIGDNRSLPAKLPPLQSAMGFEFYSDAVICIDNYSKYRGIGIAMKFQKEDGSSLGVCVRNDIHANPNYSIKAYAKGQNTSAEDMYNACSGPLVTTDFAWDKDFIIKNCLDPVGFMQYNFAGIISFHDAAA